MAQGFALCDSLTRRAEQSHHKRVLARLFCTLGTNLLKYSLSSLACTAFHCSHFLRFGHQATNLARLKSCTGERKVYKTRTTFGNCCVL